MFATVDEAFPDYSYSLIDGDTHAQIDLYTGPGVNENTGEPAGPVTIPDTLGGVPVTSIGASAFANTGFSAVTIPASVTSIGDWAFQGDSSLTSVTFAEGSQLTSIGFQAFFGTNFTSITIPSSMTSIGNSAFQNTALTSITIPATITSIGVSSFDAQRLASVTFAEGSQLTSIGASAFANDTSLTSIIIPSSVTSIGDGAFFSASTLTSITFAEGIQLTSISSQAFMGSGLTSITIPSSVTSIGNSAFYSVSTLTSVTFAEGSQLTSISGSAFGNTGITSITIPSSVTSIDNNAFAYTALTSITIPASVTSIGGYAFYGVSSLTSVTFSAGSQLTGIGSNAFANTALTSITIPASVTSIGDSAFYGVSTLTSVNFAEGSQLTSIGFQAFFATNFTSITIPASMTSIGNNAFENTALTSITIPASVTSICADAFSDTGLTQANFLGNAPTIGGSVLKSGDTTDPSSVFSGVATPFTIYYTSGKTGWTTPTWNGYNTVAVSPILTSLTLSPLSPNVMVGDTTTFTPTTLDQFGSSYSTTTTWASSKHSVGTIDADGIFSAIAVGTTTITVTAGNLSTTTIATVSALPPALTSITISPLTPSVPVGATTTFSATTLDQYGNPFSASVTWSSSQISVGTINSSGVFSAVAAGTTIITGTAGSHTATTTVTTTAVVANNSHGRKNPTQDAEGGDTDISSTTPSTTASTTVIDDIANAINNILNPKPKVLTPIKEVEVPVTVPTKLALQNLPVFALETTSGGLVGSGTKTTFTFAPTISSFITAPLPQEITSTLNKSKELKDYFATVGLTQIQDFAALSRKPMTLAGSSTPENLFTVSNGAIVLRTYITNDINYKLIQTVRVASSTPLTISFTPTDNNTITGTWNGKIISFVSNNNKATLKITAPSLPGKYYLSTSASPLPLVIEVLNLQPISTSKPTFISKVLGWLGL